MISVGQFCLIVLVSCLILAQAASGQDVKICPAEPTWPGDVCPEVCNRGCSDGVCHVYNPWQNLVVLPDTMPSLVICEGVVWMNNTAFNCWNTIKCSEHASCDFMIASGAGSYLGVNCGNTTHSCNIFCSDSSLIYDFKCNTTSSCNCQTNCQIGNTKCIPGIDCLGDSCYRNVMQECQPLVHDRTMDLVPSDSSPCNCTCKDPSLTKYKVGSIYRCLDPDGLCSTDSECNYPNGRCESDCKCINPWGGPKCTMHMCPQCQNNAFCSNSTTNPCVCTGLWTGVNCTTPIQVAPSRPENSENVARCNVTDIVQWVAPPATIASPPPCPSLCSRCTLDTDGTPVCLILLPIPNVWTFMASCPTTHRCIAHCYTGCSGILSCSGEYPCDTVCSTAACLVITFCSSSSSCKAHCSSISQPVTTTLPSKSRYECRRANGSCICDTQDCPEFTPCVPGISCNGDPCVTLDCGRLLPKYNNATSQCYCECYPQYYQTPEGNCAILDYTRDCAFECKNGGICKEQKCWCPPGYSGADCSQRDTCVALNVSAACPSACDWCDSGICFFSLRTGDYSKMDATCPVGFPCVFICEPGDCNPNNDMVICPAGSGPCELWCWDYYFSDLTWMSDLGEIRPSSGCTTISLVCEDGSIGCRSRCTAGGRPDDIYYGGRTVKSIHCGSTNVTNRSPDPLDRCSSCGSDSCYIAEPDPCYQEAQFSGTYRIFGYLLPCPSDRLGTWLIPHVNASNQCDCICPNDLSLVNGTCLALGCDPPCQHSGVCEIAVDMPGTANDTYRCRCFGGWNGVDCTSRCFFPVNANVTSCENGRYLISGELKIPGNRNISLYTDVPDLLHLEVEGDLSFGGPNVTLSISPPTNWTGTVNPSVVVSGRWNQNSGSVLENALVVDRAKGTIVTTIVNASGTVNFGGSLQLQINSQDIIDWIKISGGANVSINLITFGSLESTFDTISVKDTGGGASSGCERLSSNPQYSPSGAFAPGKMDMFFSLDTSNCEANTPMSSSSPQTPSAVSEVAAVNTAGIAIGISAAVLVVGAIVGAFFWKRHKEKEAYAAISKKITLASTNNSIDLWPMNSNAREPEVAEDARSQPAPLKWVRAGPSD